jgi:hypothetical protein
MASIERWTPKKDSNKDRWRAHWRTPDGRAQSKVFDRKITFRQYAEEWRARQVHRRTTQDRVESMFRLHVYPLIGTRPMHSIRPSHLQALVRNRLEHLAPSTVANLLQILSGLFNDAANDGVIARTPCRGIKVPRVEKVEIVPPTVEQVFALGDAISDRYRVAVALGAGA